MRFFTIPPQPIRLTAYCQLPRKRWSLLAYANSVSQKPALKGEVANEVSRRGKRGCSFFRQPLSRLAVTVPRSGSLLALCNRCPKSLPPRAGKVAANEMSRRKGCGLVEPFGLCNHRPKSCPREIFPLSHGLRRASSPASGGAFWRCATAAPKAVPACGESGHERM